MQVTRQFSHHQEIAHRRQLVLTWTAQGKHSRDIANELNLSESTIKRDLSYLMGMAKENIKSYVQDRLPFEYMKSLATLDNIKNRAFDI